MRDVQVEAGGAQTRVTEQQLDAAQVDPRFEQMRRKSVPVMSLATLQA